MAAPALCGDRPSQWEMTNFDPLQNWNPELTATKFGNATQGIQWYHFQPPNLTLNLRFGSTFGSPAHFHVLLWLWGDSRPYVRCPTENAWRRLQASWRTETTCWWSWPDPPGAPAPTLCSHLLWRFAIQQQSTAPQSGHALLTQVRLMCGWTLLCASSLVPSVLHLSHGFQCSPTLNRQPYEGRLPLTSWWRKSSNMTVDQCSLIYLAHHCYDWHPGSRCG